MIDICLKILEIFKIIGPWALIILLAILLIRIVVDEDQASKYRAKIYKFIYSLSGKIDHEKKYISNDIKSKLNIARNKMHFGKDILPKAIDVTWVQGANGSISDIKEGEFIVKLDPSADQNINIANLATAIVKRTTLLGIRHSIEPQLQQAIDINLTRNLLKTTGNKSSVDWFISNVVKKEVIKSDEFKNRYDQISIFDERGLFTRIFLVELEGFSREIHGRPPRPYMAGEIEDFVKFMDRICRRKRREEVPLRFEKAFIRTGIVIVAQKDKILSGIEPYIRAINYNIENHVSSIYVLIYEKEWIEDLESSTQKMWKQQIQSLKMQINTYPNIEIEYDADYNYIDPEGNKRKGECIKLAIKG